MYAAGVEYWLHPFLFPRETVFATAQLRYSLFGPFVANVSRTLHLPLPLTLLCLHLLSAALMLWAALRVAILCFSSRRARWCAVALIAACWTLPLAGTSLTLMDPYVTARSFSTPLTLLASAEALVPWTGWQWNAGSLRHPALRCSLLLAFAAVFHPLMAGYGLIFVLSLRLTVSSAPKRLWASFVVIVLGTAATVQLFAKPEGQDALAADFSRYYWFLSQWRWFEWLGLAGPLAIYAGLVAWKRAEIGVPGRSCCRASIFTGALSVTVALGFGQQIFVAHPVARVQPLRLFLLPYLLMLTLLGGLLGEMFERFARRARNAALAALLKITPALTIALVAGAMFLVQRATFAGSTHLELPGRENANPWVQAFVWARQNTPSDAFFALDADYADTPGEDGQFFPAISERSALADFAKDGGTAANFPALAPEWHRSASATQRLSELSDVQRHTSLAPFGVQWVVLRAGARTEDACPYRNDVVKVCRLP